MRNLLVVPILLAAVAVLSSCGGQGGATGGAGKGNVRTIAVIPKGTTHEFWQSVKAGAVRAGKEFKVNIDWVGPEKEDDRGQEIAIVENMILKGVNGIVLAPLDRKALMAPVNKAMAAKVPVVIIDSALDGNDWVSFVATDNYKGGQLGGKRSVELLGGKPGEAPKGGRVIMLRYQENSASTEEREAGWLAEIKKHPDITIKSDEQRSGATKESAQTASENLLDRFTKDGKLDCDVIFCPNESSAYGMLMALRGKRLAGQVKFVGFDASKALIIGLAKGEIHGLVLQNPEKMGYMGVKTMVEHLDGKKVDRRVDTGVALITKEDLAKPQTKALVPQVEEWMKDAGK